MGQARVDKLASEYDVEVEWKAFELHPGIPAEGQEIPFSPERRAQGRASFQRLADEAGLPYGERSHWYDSAPAHEAYLWAAEHRRGSELKRGVFEAYFVRDQNIASPDVLAAIVDSFGLPADDLRAALAEGRYREAVQAEFQEARELGVTAVPTFVAAGYALVGAHPYESFHKLMEAAGERPRGGSTG